jgi:hypothetical protein
MTMCSETVPATRQKQTRTDARFQGRSLLIARAVWIVVALLELVLFLLNLLAPAFGGKTSICPFSSTCGYAPTTLQALQHAQISTSAFNIYLLVLSLLDALITVGLGVLIFFRKPDQPSSWLASLTLFLLRAGLLLGEDAGTPPAFQQFAIVGTVLAFCTFFCIGFFMITFPDGRLVVNFGIKLLIFC